MTDRFLAAVDLGAASGRVMLGRVGPDRLQVRDIHRFNNGPAERSDGLHWDIRGIQREVLEGIRLAAAAAAFEGAELASIGIDGWGVDYGLLDSAGALVQDPYHYRDGRTGRAVEAVHARVEPADLYRRTGVQFLPFNTIYQLVADLDSPVTRHAAGMLLVPDLLVYWLTGVRGAEVTNASTTALLDPHRRTWDLELARAVGIEAGLLPTLSTPGTIVGSLNPQDGRDPSLPAAAEVTLVGSHDTASAVVGAPMEGDGAGYIASGTWSLVGVELDRPILSEASRTANFTNESGVDNRIRFLRNVMGLWLLQETMRTWERAGSPESLRRLLRAAAEVKPGGPTIDVDDPIFLPPGDMPARIAAACERTGAAAPASRPGLVRCILDSLASAYAHAVQSAAQLSGRAISVVHVVGGGSQNALLCQLTANACELSVVAGPVEATAIGNVLVQARAHGFIEGDLETMRGLVRATSALRRFEPGPLAAGTFVL